MNRTRARHAPDQPPDARRSERRRDEPVERLVLVLVLPVEPGSFEHVGAYPRRRGHLVGHLTEDEAQCTLRYAQGSGAPQRARECLREIGVPREQIHVEHFTD